MAENYVAYSVMISIPFNKETSKLWSPERSQTGATIMEIAEKMMRIITNEGCISMGRIFRLLKMREQPDQPQMFFDLLDDVRIEDEDEENPNGDLEIILEMSYVHAQEPVSSKNKPFQLHIVEPEEPSDSEKEATAECTGLKETSGSEESETT